MQFLNVKRIADKWKISERRVISLLQSGRVPGAIKNGLSWQIPSGAIKPYDRRTRYSAYERTNRRVVIAGINNEIGISVANILSDNGFDIIGLYQTGAQIPQGDYKGNVQLVNVNYLDEESLLDFCESVPGYLDGLVFSELFLNPENDMDTVFRSNVIPMKTLSMGLAKKMNYDSAIVILNSTDWGKNNIYSAIQYAKISMVKTLSDDFARLYGVRINCVTASWPGNTMDNKNPEYYYMGMPDEIADDIFIMLTRHKFTNAGNIESYGEYLYFDQDGSSEELDTKKFYIWLHKIWGDLKSGDNAWGVETMQENEWIDNSLERQYLQDILDAVQRGAKLKQIILFSRRDLKKHKNNKFLISLSTNKKIDAMWCDSDVIAKKAPELLAVVGLGLFGFNENLLGVNLPPAPDGSLRGQYIQNKKEISKAKKTFLLIKKYTVPLKTVIK